MDFKNKYLKYKNKYLELKKYQNEIQLYGGSSIIPKKFNDFFTMEELITENMGVSNMNYKDIGLDKNINKLIYLANEKSVKSILFNFNPKKVAVKIFMQPNCDQYGKMKNEIDILNLLGKHSSLIEFIGVYKDNNNIYVVTEFLEGYFTLNLDDYHVKYKSKNKKSEEEKNNEILKKNERKSELKTNICAIFKKIYEAVNYLHKSNVYHYNLNPENIIIKNKFSNNLEIKIINFYVACYNDNCKILNCENPFSYYSLPFVNNKITTYNSLPFFINEVTNYILLSSINDNNKIISKEQEENKIKSFNEENETKFKNIISKYCINMPKIYDYWSLLCILYKIYFDEGEDLILKKTKLEFLYDNKNNINSQYFIKKFFDNTSDDKIVSDNDINNKIIEIDSKIKNININFNIITLFKFYKYLNILLNKDLIKTELQARKQKIEDNLRRIMKIINKNEENINKMKETTTANIINSIENKEKNLIKQKEFECINKKEIEEIEKLINKEELNIKIDDEFENKFKKYIEDLGLKSNTSNV